MKKFILTANSARKALIDGNPFEIANFAKKAGSNITLNDKKVVVSLKNPWNLAAHAASRRKFPKLICWDYYTTQLKGKLPFG